MVITKLEQHKIAALHLDELQDSGRHFTSESMKHFTVRIRNFMQKKNWPVCIIVTGTIEAKTIINQDETFLRRLRPIGVLPMVLKKEGKVMQFATKKVLAENQLPDNGMPDETEFLKTLMYAAGYRFGMAIEIVIEAIGLAKLARDQEINMDHFADAYSVRMNCDDEMNPFISLFWKSIDTPNAMDRYILEDKNRRKKLPRT